VYPYLDLIKRKKEFLDAAEDMLTEDEAVDKERSRQNEEHYFSCVGPERHALARHLTMIAQRNKRFVADKRLWRWIALYLKERDVYMFS
jgi:hypothetical protein